MSLASLRTALEQGPHVSAFLMLGDPSPRRSLALALRAVELGSTMLELGFPYEDPCADGPAIQAASHRARTAGVSTTGALELLRAIRASCATTPLNLLVYANLVHARGYERFCADAARAGASSLLVPDLPLEEAGTLREACAAHDLGYVALLGPRTDPARMRELDRASTAFVYLAALQGVTGGTANARTRDELVRRVVSHVAHPVCAGFGLASPEDVRGVFDAGARIAVVGSHLARAIARGLEPGADALSSFTAAFAPLVAPRSAASAPSGTPPLLPPSASASHSESSPCS